MNRRINLLITKCKECPYLDMFSSLCDVFGEEKPKAIYNRHGIPDWCPLEEDKCKEKN